MKRWQHILVALIAIVVGVPNAVLLFDRDPPFESTAATVAPATPSPGDDIVVILRGRNLRHCTGTVHREIADAQGRIYLYEEAPALVTDFPAHYELSRRISLPPNIPLGPAQYRAWPTYQCNWTQYFWPIKPAATVLSFEVVIRASPAAPKTQADPPDGRIKLNQLRPHPRNVTGGL